MIPEEKMVEKRCDWNRYCSHVGPFHAERLLEIGTNRPVLVGRCYSCGGFVCNRCASRRLMATGAGTRLIEAWELLCPLDGYPLGRGEDWAMFGGKAESLRRVTGPPGEDVLIEVFARGLVRDGSSPQASAISQLLERVFQEYAANEYQAVLDISTDILRLSPNNANALLMRRWALENLHRYDDAWETMRRFFQANPESLRQSLGELNTLDSVDAHLRNSFSQEILAALKTAAPADEGGLGRVTIPKRREEGADDLVQATDASVVPQSTPKDGSAGATEKAPETGPASRRRPVKLEGIPRRALITSLSPATLDRILGGLPPAAWGKDDWSRFVALCREAGALASPQSLTFSDDVWRLEGGADLVAHPIPGQMLVETGPAVAQNTHLDLAGLFDLYAGTCFHRTEHIRARLSETEDGFLPAELIGEHVFRTGSAMRTDLLGRQMSEAVPGSGAIEDWIDPLKEYIQCCPMLFESAEEVSFSHPSFESHFLSRRLYRCLFQADKPDFRLAGSRCLDANTAVFLAGLLARSEHHLDLLEEWLQMKRMRRSLFRGADIPTFVRNLALVRLMLKNDVRSIDLTDADFNGLELDHADFSQAILAGANFRNADLRGARFLHCDLSGATFDGSDLTGTDFGNP